VAAWSVDNTATQTIGAYYVNPLLQELIDHLDLERLETNLFRGESRDIGSLRVFGGQVLGQALMAACATVEGRSAHSLHAYFLRPGDFNAPIVYEVERNRDGRSFSSRRVVAIQHGRHIFTLAASFQVPEAGVEHQSTMPVVPDPEGLKDIEDYAAGEKDNLPEKLRRYLWSRKPFSCRPVQPIDYLAPQQREPRKQIWFKAVDTLPDDPNLHLGLMAYVSDYDLLTTSTLPHGLAFMQGNVQMASLDHAMWLHRPFRLDQWLLYDCDSPVAVGARGLSRGSVYTREGILVASVAQEGLIRVWDGPKPE